MNVYITVFSLAVVLTLVGYFWLAIVGFKRSVLWGVLILLFSPITAIIYAMTNWFDARKAFLLYIIAFVLMCGTASFIYTEVGIGNMKQIAEKMNTGKLGPRKAYALITKALSHTGPMDLFAEDLDPAAANETATNAAQIAGNPASAKAVTELSQTETQPGKPSENQKLTAVAEAAAPMPATPKDAEEAEAKAANATAPKPSEVKPVEVKVEKPKFATPDKAQPDPLAQKRKKEEANTVVVRLEKISNYTGHYFIITLKTGNQRRGLLRKVDDTNLYLDRKLYGGNIKYKVRKDQIKSIEMLKHVPDER